MDHSDAAEGVGSGDAPELCDGCGRMVPARQLVVSRAPDSSAVSMDARLDGQRLLRACCEPHLIELAVGYLRRPFVPEELWSGQITRAVRLLDPLEGEQMYEQVVAITGLDEEQVMRAVAWQEGHGSPFGSAPD
ncbi:hypothetical protein OG871_39300 [Kitasatospora sp. NBC_00374]|uniref:hypothetical protein n=1 Tax=Kitasatospora sp. NBC_00374 TaxID=2975964 RepID=UPI00324B4857